MKSVSQEENYTERFLHPSVDILRNYLKSVLVQDPGCQTKISCSILHFISLQLHFVRRASAVPRRAEPHPIYCVQTKTIQCIWLGTAVARRMDYDLDTCGFIKNWFPVCPCP